MRSDKQNEASKNNGKKSKGPATPEGKAASSRNAVLHNLSCGRLVLLPNEDPNDFHDFQNGYLHRFQPADSVELDLVQKMVAAAWRERRISAMESALFEIEMDRQSGAVDEEWEEITPASRQVLVFFGTTDASFAANLLLRYGAAARRDFASALRILRDLQGPRFNRFRGPLSGVTPNTASTPTLQSVAPGTQPVHTEEPPENEHDLAVSTGNATAKTVRNRRRPAEADKNRQTPYATWDITDLPNEPNEVDAGRNTPPSMKALAAA